MTCGQSRPRGRLSSFANPSYPSPCVTQPPPQPARQCTRVQIIPPTTLQPDALKSDPPQQMQPLRKARHQPEPEPSPQGFRQGSSVTSRTPEPGIDVVSKTSKQPWSSRELTRPLGPPPARLDTPSHAHHTYSGCPLLLVGSRASTSMSLRGSTQGSGLSLPSPPGALSSTVALIRLRLGGYGGTAWNATNVVNSLGRGSPAKPGLAVGLSFALIFILTISLALTPSAHYTVCPTLMLHPSISRERQEEEEKRPPEPRADLPDGGEPRYRAVWHTRFVS